MATSQHPIPEPDQKGLLKVSDLDSEECSKDRAEARQAKLRTMLFFLPFFPQLFILNNFKPTVKLKG